MFLLFLLLSCSSWILKTQSSGPVGDTPHIWNGVNGSIDKWPFMASIRLGKDRDHLGGAAVLNDDTILTAAHCIPPGQPLDSRVVVLGQTLLEPLDEENVYPIRQFIQHPQYLKNESEYDIGLIKLSRKIDFKKAKGRITKACLPSPDAVPDGSKCVAIGWGGTAPGTDSKGVLQQVDIPIVPCKGDHPRVICAGYYDKPNGICYGDSGGPLVCPPKNSPNKYLLYGLTAILWSNCGEAPAGFTKVSHFLKWIRENAEN